MFSNLIFLEPIDPYNLKLLSRPSYQSYKNRSMIGEKDHNINEW